MPNRAAPRRSARVLTVAVVLVGAVAVLGAIALWPRGPAPETDGSAIAYVDATVTDVDGVACPAGAGEDRGSGSDERDGDGDGASSAARGDDAGSGTCSVVTAELTSGPDEGEVVDATAGVLTGDAPDLAAGDRIVLVETAGRAASDRYAFAGRQRAPALSWLVATFVAVLLLVGRRQGLRALAGLVAGGAVLLAFVVPALADGRPAVPVVLAGVAVIALAVLYLGRGVDLRTTVAVAGTLAGLALVAVLAVAAAAAADLAGLAGEDPALGLVADALDLRGLLVAGVVIGALGALGDVALSQTSLVAALRHANPGLRPRLLFREAVRAGRDHVNAAVTTLVFAYVGASLPLLVLVAQVDRPAGPVLTADVVAVVIVRMLVGAIALVVAAPVTAALAALALGPGEPRGEPRRRSARRRADDSIEEVPAHLAGITRGG
jgi:uncharacterized membrane protein